MIDVTFDGKVICDDKTTRGQGALFSMDMKLLFSCDEDPRQAIDYAAEQLKKAVGRIREERIGEELDAPGRKLQTVFGDLADSGRMSGVGRSKGE